MTADLTEVIADLAALLPEAAQLIPQPDTTPGHAHTKPGSKPPWNVAVANVYFDALEHIRRLEHTWRSDLAGRYVQSRPLADWAETLASIERLAHAIPAADVDHAARQLGRHITRILQLPAIDREERPQHIRDTGCPYCQRSMLRIYPKAGIITCLAYGACFDTNGDHPRGVMTIGQASGEPMIAWADGLVQTPPAQEGLAS